jgi:hypothetical protein
VEAAVALLARQALAPDVPRGDVLGDVPHYSLPIAARRDRRRDGE